MPKLRKSAGKSLSQPGCSHSNTIYNLELQKTIVLRKQPQHQATFMQPFQCGLQAQIQETHRTMHTGTTIVAKHEKEPNDPSRTRRTHEVEGTKRCNIHAAIPMHPPHTRGTFQAGIELRTQTQPLVAKHIEGTEHEGFMLRLPPHNIARHATFMQPLQCVLQHPVANLHLSTHVATSDDDNHAAIPMLFATRDSRTA